ncbi:type II 3-dehydroquinate dehydratase [Butyricimonas sp. Marseille-P3923]|uniref:type II 3-dehydroquinate dehydratase n=1 Tax=Butyricimonas sp. Marseille-P3923 TaxID=1987504 RepID=UPI000C067EC8|nr:type II 3-dehydroquinate dehydratase [Butyricimonas sp. Marseille-P3923]
MKVLILNGPNLNLLGVREKSVYGETSFDDYLAGLREFYKMVEIDYYQSNVEGELINKIHEVGFACDGIILNAGAYTHTSIAIADAISAISCPVIEVHISNTAKREPFRHVSYLTAVCRGVIAGFGLKSYELALQALLDE